MMPKTSRLLLAGLLASLGTLVAGTAAAQNVSVTAADPPSGYQGTVSLVVKITGKNFAPGARSDFFLSGTTNPGGVTVRGTQFVSSTEVDATVDIASSASLSYFDIKVTNTSGRSGKGSDLFKVTTKTASCDANTYKLAPVPIVLDTAPANAGCGSGLSGTLDCTFGTSGNGLVTTAVVPGNTGIATIQPDGKVVLAVRGSGSAVWDTYVMRYGVNGALDTGFGSGGIAHVGLTAATDQEYPLAITVQPDGRILVAGGVPQKTPYGNKAAVMRLTSAGLLDTTFGTSGRVLLSFASDKWTSDVYDVQVDRAGRILLAGSTGGQFAVARLTSSGALDPTFGTNQPQNGKAVFQSGSLGGGIWFQDLGDGQGQYLILAGTSATCSGTDPQMSMVRMRPDGTVDPTFGPAGNGQALVDFSGRPDHAGAVLVDPVTNEIVLVGYSNPYVAVAHLLSNGTIDTSFGTGGGTVVTVAGLANSASGLTGRHIARASPTATLAP